MPLVFVKQLGIMTLLLVSLLATSTFAETYCKADYSDAVSDINQARTECETAEGGGSTFYVSEIVKDSSCTESYDGGESITFAGWRYLLGCDMCTSQNAKKELNDFSETCQAQCKVSDYKCSYTMWSWGDNHFTQKICGKTDSTLSGCSESSSSTEKSSSSGNSSSSSGESSSSGFGEEESSDSGSGSLSSGGGIPGSSGLGCSGDYCDVANAPQGEFGFVGVVFPCGKRSDIYLRELGYKYCSVVDGSISWAFAGVDGFMSLPDFIGSARVMETSCDSGRLKIVSNLSPIRRLGGEKITGYQCFSDEINQSLKEYGCNRYSPLELCKRDNSSWVDDFCSDTVKVITGANYRCTDSNDSSTVAGCVRVGNKDWPYTYFLERNGEIFYYSVFGRNDLVLPRNYREYWNMDSLKGLLSACPVYSSSSESSDMSSSSESEEVSSSSAFHDFSSASEGNYSSGFEMTSSSISIGSSSMGNFGNSSSSFSEEASSASGGYVSSSSKAEGFESETFVAGEKQIYSPEQVFNDGLRNMEIGKCYSLNPERGIQFGWINDNAQDSWWWMEVPCDGSVPLIETTSAGCYENRRGPTAIYLPGDCFSGGLDNMETGKCYALNSDRGAQYGWINNNAQDSYWWVEVPCEVGDSEDEPVCPENGIFFKRNEPLETSEDSVKTLGESVVGLYDALGRKQKHRNVFGKRNAFYARKAHRDRRTVREFFENWSVSFKTVSGYVEAKTELGFRNVHFDCVSQTKTIIVADLYMKTPKDSIDKVVDSDDERLLAHENRHEEIYLLEGNDEWKEKISVNRNRLTEKNSCYIVKKTFWPVMEKRYRKMLEIQNAWDDEDKNNASHARINIDSLVVLQKIKWNAEPCYKENSE